MKIGVSGASGHLGRVVVAELLQRGAAHEVIAISRTPQSVIGKVETRVGDYDSPDTLAPAYSGLDRLLLIPSADLEPGKRGRQLGAAIDAAVAAGVKHIVLVSASGTKHVEEPALGACYWRGEQELIAKAPSWTILRMGYYAEAFAVEAGSSLESGVLAGLAENRVAFVSRDDVGAAAAGILIGDGHDGAIYTATGEERISGAKRAKLIAEATGRPMSFLVLPEEHLRGGLAQAGLPDTIINAIISIQKSFANGAFDIVTGDVERLAGRAPRPLGDVLAASLSSSAA